MIKTHLLILFFIICSNLGAKTTDESVINYYLKRIQSSPKDLHAHLQIAQAYIDQQNIELAKKHFEKALEIAPNSFSAKEGLAYSLHLLKDYEAALEIYKAIIVKDNKNDLIHYNLGAVYLDMNKIDLAKREFLSSLKINPKNASSSMALAEIYKKEKSYAQAKATYEAILNHSPDLILTRYKLAQLLYVMGEKKLSLKHFDQVVANEQIHALPDIRQNSMHMGNIINEELKNK